MKRVTIKDIANHLHLSVSTISRALADDKNIKRETKEQVFEAAKELGYHRNLLAASLRRGRSNTVGVIVNEMLTPFASEVIKGIQNVMHEKGIRVLICNSNNNPEQELRNIRLMENSLTDGIIIAMCHDSHNLDEFRRLQEKGIPMVFFNSTPRGFEVSGVVMNSYSKSFFLVDHLVCSGRRKIVLVRGPQATVDMVDIYKAYLDSLAKFNIPVNKDLIVDADLSVEEGERIADLLVEKEVDFDAVFASHELLAIGIMNRLRDHGITIPDDVSIAGFSGSTFSKLVYPKLTTVEPPLEEMGVKAAEMLLEKLDHPGAAPKKIVIDAKIELRESSHGK